MNKKTAAQKRLYRALDLMRRRRRNGLGPPAQHNLNVEGPDAELERIAERSPEPEPWARYLAPFRYQLQKHS